MEADMALQPHRLEFKPHRPEFIFELARNRSLGGLESGTGSREGNKNWSGLRIRFVFQPNPVVPGTTDNDEDLFVGNAAIEALGRGRRRGCATDGPP
jgi:hypothetical protein